MMRLYDYWRSSAAYRVRIALNLKGLKPETAAVDLRRNGGEQHGAAFAAVNPQKLVPALDDSGQVLTQSLAIIEYLDETYPQPPLLPGTAHDRARIRAMALTVAADIHPIQNLRVLKYLQQHHGASEAQTQAWARHWISLGFEALEGLVQRAPQHGPYCYGNSVTLADIALVPQMANARRFGCDVSVFPRLVAVDAALCALPAFSKAAPENQPGAS